MEVFGSLHCKLKPLHLSCSKEQDFQQVKADIMKVFFVAYCRHEGALLKFTQLYYRPFVRFNFTVLDFSAEFLSDLMLICCCEFKLWLL